MTFTKEYISSGIGKLKDGYIGYIYLITHNKGSEKFYYIGKRENTDFFNDYYMGSGVIIKRKILHYGKENFKKSLIFSSTSIEELWELEKIFIKLWRDKFPNNMYNIAAGGEGFSSEEATKINIKRVRNKTHNFMKCNISEETWKLNRENLRATNIEKIKNGTHTFLSSRAEMSEETKRKIGASNSVALRGRKLSEEHCKNMSLRNKRLGIIPPSWEGKKHSTETLKLMKDVQTGFVYLHKLDDESMLYYSCKIKDLDEINSLIEKGWSRGKIPKDTKSFYRKGEWFVNVKDN